jgi:ATP-dependent Clp protease ATP-binding subunit ClpA
MIAQELEVSLHMAFVEARQQRHEFITVEHLLLALLAQDEGIVVPVLQRVGANVTSIRTTAETEAGRYAKQSDAQPTFSRELTQVVDAAEREAKTLGDEFISTEHTAKNLLIVAQRTRPAAASDDPIAERIRDFARFYGVRHQRLATHLGFVL